MKNRKIKLAVIAAAIGASVLLTAGACDATGKAAQPYNDAKVSGQNKDAASIGTMPDGFSNYATKCDNGNRVYVLFHGDAAYGDIDVVPNDPTCA
jgi:hypothetical protein